MRSPAGIVTFLLVSTPASRVASAVMPVAVTGALGGECHGCNSRARRRQKPDL
jgi:hypothetical protein